MKLTTYSCFFSSQFLKICNHSHIRISNNHFPLILGKSLAKLKMEQMEYLKLLKGEIWNILLKIFGFYKVAIMFSNESEFHIFMMLIKLSFWLQWCPCHTHVKSIQIYFPFEFISLLFTTVLCIIIMPTLNVSFI